MSRLDEPLYLGAYWGGRPEDSQTCANRLTQCLSAIASVSPSLSRWKPKGRSESVALAAPFTESSELQKQLQSGVNRRDFDGSAIPELGMRWSSWNGDTTLTAAITVTCGADAATSGILNSFVLKLPEFAANGASEIFGAAESLMTGVVEAWEPDWAVLTSHQLRESIYLEPDQPTVGWLTYVGPSRNTGGLGWGLAGGKLIRSHERWEDLDVEALRPTIETLADSGALGAIR